MTSIPLSNSPIIADSRPKVLISGASFAGLATAWWMHRLGYAVTVIEIANGLRLGGTPVNIRDGVIAVVQRMGLFERIVAESLPPRPVAFLAADGTPLAIMAMQGQDPEDRSEEYEIERDALLTMLFAEVNGKVEFLFGDSISRVEESAEQVTVTLASGAQRSATLLLGCDGTHSAVRRLCFGEESTFLRYLQHYFSLTIVDKLLIDENTSQMFNLPGKTIMLNAYNGKTDVAFCFLSEQEIAYDRRDREAQKRMITRNFAGQGWRTPELLNEMLHCDDFYFDKLCQIRMPAWTRGRVALVGDAGYCPSPAAGMGGSMAILGAAALADALQKFPADLQRALQEYDDSLRPTVLAIQTDAIVVGMEMFAPRSQEAIDRRNAQMNLTHAS